MISTPPPRTLYVEINSYCVAWLRHLIQRGLIADGDVVDFSLTDLRPADLQRYTQVHFCAGIGIWSLGARRGGWSDSRRLWTASLPCQPFSAAGKGDGFADERHLWPEFFHLVEQCRPEIILGEQVASKDGLAWLDLVQSDMEGTGYTFGSVDSCSAGFGAPHIRQRMYWMAHTDPSIERTDATGGHDGHGYDAGRPQGAGDVEGRDEPCQLEHTLGTGSQRYAGYVDHGNQSGRLGADQAGHATATSDALDQLAYTPSTGRRERSADAGGCGERSDPQGLEQRFGNGRFLGPVELANADGGDASDCDVQRSGIHRLEPSDDVPGGERHTGIGHNGAPDVAADWPGPTNGFWRDADWIFCRDGKWRPVEPGTFPLAHGLPRSLGTGGASLARMAKVAGLDAESLARAKEYRIGALRAYGNAINAEQAADFCAAALAALLG